MKELIKKYKALRDKYAEEINSGKLNEYSHTVRVHKHNLLVDIIKDLERLQNN